MTNLIVNMRRQQLSNLKQCENAGLFLDRGFGIWAKDATNQTAQHNEEAHRHHKAAAEITYSELYEKAFEDWQQIHTENKSNSQLWQGQLEGRMYLGTGEVSPIEAGITLHQTYGVPYIPGSAIKGVLSHYADDIGLGEDIKELLFGTEEDPKKKKESASGYIIFNDAWWVPKGKSLIPEVITVHASEYYKTKGKTNLHPDFEKPNPNPQIAIQGSFLFSVEGNENWVKYAIELLKKAMQVKGIGGKTASGYGYFTQDLSAKIAEFDIWPTANLKIIQNRQGTVVEAVIVGKTAQITLSNLQSDFNNLSNSKQKKMKKSTGISQSVEVEKVGNEFRIVRMIFDE